MGDQVPGLNQAIKDIKTYEMEVSGQLQTLRQSGNDGVLGYKY